MSSRNSATPVSPAQYPTRLLDFEGHDNVRTLSLLANNGA